MAVSYEGKKPSRFWYFRKRVAALGKTFKNKQTQGEAHSLRRDALITAGTLATGIAFLAVPYAALFPVLATIGAPVAGTASLLFGLKSWLTLKRLNRSNVVYFDMQEAETKWLQKKQRPRLGARIKGALGRSLTAAKNAALAPLRLFKRKEKPVLPAPGAAPAITSVESTKPAPAVAENFDSAATSQKADRVDAPDAEDLRRQEEARLRAEERARRKRAGGDKPRFY